MVRLFLLLILLTTAMSHSYMVTRKSNWYSKRRPHCRRGGPEGTDDKCDGPCEMSDTGVFDPSAPILRWRRGERRIVRWHRNGHSHGFVRLTLVPAWDILSKRMHEKNTFLYTCFDANREKCNKTKEWCGTGNYSSHIGFDVPAVPNGDYVLGWTWFGSYGTNHGKVNYHFGDYWSCAKVRVRGGVQPEHERPRPTFDSGTEAGFCRSLGNRLGVCTIEPCIDTYKGLWPRPMCPVGMVMEKEKCVGEEVEIEASPSPNSADEAVMGKRESRAEPVSAVQLLSQIEAWLREHTQKD